MLTEATVSANPFAQFGLWFEDAKGLPEPNAMVLSTVQGGTSSQPSSRVVLLKAWDEAGFVFFSNYGSRKAHEIEAQPHVSLLFFWPTLARQIRIEGTVTKTTREESAGYFRTRARISQLGAWASAQSTVIPSRAYLDERLRELGAEYEGREVPVPPFWGGYRVAPSVFEFWQGRDHRMHDRLRYTRDGSSFHVERLSP